MESGAIGGLTQLVQKLAGMGQRHVVEVVLILHRSMVEMVAQEVVEKD